MTSSIAFFDLDKTLLGVNSASLWVKREMRAGNLSTLQALRGAFWILLYELGLARMEDVLHDAIATLRGKRERDVIDRTLEFYRECVAATILPAGRAAVARHKAAGDLVFLLTSSSNYLSAPLSDELQLDGFLANRFVVDGGVFTGLPELPLCYGPGKVAHAQVVAEKLHIELRACSFYTDSVTDLPMLEAVGTPVTVDPDPRLRRIAKKRGWPIENWKMSALPPARSQ